METIYLIIIANVVISLFSLLGVFTLGLKQKLLDRLLLLMVAFSAGGLMGGAFVHILPEAVEAGDAELAFIYLLVGFISFFLMEKALHWRHCHKGNCEVHTFTYMSLFGDAIHNFVDGMVIAAAFVANVSLGIATTIAIAFHEIPQELGDYAVLVYGGFSRKKALLMNFLVALTAVLGGIIGFWLAGEIESFASVLLPLAAGGFIYIAASDLIPEIRNVKSLSQSMATFVFFILGIAAMFLIKAVMGG